MLRVLGIDAVQVVEVPTWLSDHCASTPFELGPASDEHSLHLFGRFVFEIFAKIAVGTCNLNLFCVLGDFFLH